MLREIPDILRKIVEVKKDEVALLKKEIDFIKEKALSAKPPLDFKKALYSNPSQHTVIAEIKKASPSAGIISSDFDPVAIAREYEDGGANAISVLTDQKFFQGSNIYLSQVKENVNIPVLRKDFIISPEQIIESRAIGADSFLLIAAIISSQQLADFIQHGRELNMEPLVEIHDENELEKAIGASAGIIGINNRNLRDFKVDIKTTARLVPLIPKNKVIVGESGITSIEITSQLYSIGCNSLLIGEFLMKSKNKAETIRKIQEAN